MDRPLWPVIRRRPLLMRHPHRRRAPDPAAGAVGAQLSVDCWAGCLRAGRAERLSADYRRPIGAHLRRRGRPASGYYLAQGNCYYRYPSGQYVPSIRAVAIEGRRLGKG